MTNQKGISTLVGIIIIIVVAVILFGGVFTYQYFTTKTSKIISTTHNTTANQQTTTINNSGLLASPTSGAAPLTVQFNRNLIGCASDISIDYGDGTSCTTANPDGSENCSVFTHTYQNSGVYNAKVHCFMSQETTGITITVK